MIGNCRQKIVSQVVEKSLFTGVLEENCSSHMFSLKKVVFPEKGQQHRHGHLQFGFTCNVLEKGPLVLTRGSVNMPLAEWVRVGGVYNCGGQIQGT